MSRDIGTVVRIIDNDVDRLQEFFSDFESIDEIRAQEAYIGMVGMIEEFLERDGIIVKFSDNSSILVMITDTSLTDEPITPAADLPQIAKEVFTRLDAGERELLDKIIVAMAPNGRDPNVIVNEAVDIVLARTRAMLREYGRYIE